MMYVCTLSQQLDDIESTYDTIFTTAREAYQHFFVFIGSASICRCLARKASTPLELPAQWKTLSVQMKRVIELHTSEGFKLGTAFTFVLSKKNRCLHFAFYSKKRPQSSSRGQFPYNLDLKQNDGTLYADGVSSRETGTHGSCRIPSFERHFDIPVSVNSPTPLMLRDADHIHTPNCQTWFK